MNIAIIGAGVGGLNAARHALQANIGNVTVFEQSDRVGGMWVYTDQVGVDEFGLKIHNSMYHGLVTNSPKEIMAFPGIPFDAHEASYLRSNDVLQYIQRLAKNFDLESVVRFRHRVTSVRPVPDSTKWTLTARNLLNGDETSAVYDAVFVCNGHYSVPAFPDNIAGRELFRGVQLHSHEYRRPEQFAGKSVLVIGSGPSGTDIAWLISTAVSKLAISVHGPNRDKIASTFGEGVVRTDVRSLSATEVTFADETVEEFDVILYCTGYQYEFPFLDAECGITANDCHVKPLFKQCIHMERPTMFFIGLTSCDLSFLVMDTQVRVAMGLLLNKWQLPTLEEMQWIAAEDLQRCWDRGYNKRQAHRIFDFLPVYLGDLTALAKLEPISPVVFKIFDHAVITTNTNWKMFRKEKFAIVDKETFTSKF